VLDIFEEEGVDLRAVTVGHCNDSLDPDYVIGLARRGATIGLDRYNPNRTPAELERRAQLALDVIKAGYASHMTLSHDRAAFSINGGPPTGGPRPEDADCYVRVSQQEIPWLLAHGATEADIQASLVGAVRAMFEAASAMKRG
jgi:phosphotriesterase-related protein